MRTIVTALAMLLATGASALAASPVELYTLNCWGCHQPHGERIRGTVPQLAHSMGYFLETSEGRAYLVKAARAELSKRLAAMGYTVSSRL